MRTMFRSAFVACAFLASFGAGSVANAAVLFSLTGTVGDSHWTPDGPFEELTFNYGGPFLPEDGGPGGLIQINYAGEAQVVTTNDEANSFDDYDFYLCANPAGCTQFSDYIHNGGDEDFGHQTLVNTKRGPDSYENIIDGNPAIDTLQMPAFTPYGGTWTRELDGITNYTFDDLVLADAVGTPFTITISTVPEPATWAMFLVGFGGIGFMLRHARRKGAAVSVCGAAKHG
jgi:hypothetical protein